MIDFSVYEERRGVVEDVVKFHRTLWVTSVSFLVPLSLCAFGLAEAPATLPGAPRLDSALSAAPPDVHEALHPQVQGEPEAVQTMAVLTTPPAELARELAVASSAHSPRPEDSTLPVPEAPAPPVPKERFDVPRHDRASAAIRSIARRVSRFRAYREEIPGAVWSVDEGAIFSIRADLACRRALAREHVPVLPLERPLTTPVPSPVVLSGPVEGVQFHPLQTDRQIEISCELAARLPALARILKKHDVRSVSVNSSYRDNPRTSFHTFGLALDIAALRTSHEVLSVLRHFEVTPDVRTCEAEPKTEEGRKLRALACDLAASHVFSSVLTPNYNSGHRDHFHLDLRPDDPRFFVR